MGDKVKYCKFCGQVLVKREKETGYFERRKYCNTSCARNDQKRKGHWRHDLNLTSRREY